MLHLKRLTKETGWNSHIQSDTLLTNHISIYGLSQNSKYRPDFLDANYISRFAYLFGALKGGDSMCTICTLTVLLALLKL